MKKFISLLLAVLMLFSMTTVAFAEGETTTAPAEDSSVAEGETNDNPLIDMDEEAITEYLENMTFAEAKAMFKIAKIAVKIALVLDKLGFIDLSPIKNAILDMAWGMIKDFVEDQTTTEEETTVENVETTVPAAA